jgi:CRP-like cAMP-binding protein
MPDSSVFQRLSFTRGSILFEEGTVGDAVYMITSGQVQIQKAVPGDAPEILGVRGPSEIIGEMALIDDSPHMATVVALEDTVVSAMSRDEFQRHLETMSPIMRGTVRVIVQRAREMGEMLVQRHTAANARNTRKKS